MEKTILKKSILISILSVIAIVFITSCDDSSTKPTVIEELIPFKIGNYWIYDVFSYDTLGNVTNQYEQIDKIVSDTIINNERVYMKIDYIEDQIEMSGALIKRADGIYIYFDQVGAFMVWKFPILKGENFDVMGRVWTVESTNYNYVTSIRNFSCYHYAIVSYNEKQSFYFQPGVGCVAIELFGTTQSGRNYIQQKFVLKEYKVN